MIYFTSTLIFADKEMISKMLERLEKLLNGVAVQRALSVQSIDHSEIVRLAELRVVRECNLPDSYTTFLDVSLLERFRNILSTMIHKNKSYRRDYFNVNHISFRK